MMLTKRLTKIPSSSLHLSKPTWWLESRFHFSFADWYGPGVKQNFGPLRVVNDDLVKPRSGFGTHPHRDAEIFSYVISGSLSHQDSMGNKEALPSGGVQYLSAGTGIRHSEMNDGAETCRFLQVWLTPDARGHQPQYGSFITMPEQRSNKFLVILRGSGQQYKIPSWASLDPNLPVPSLHQDATVMVSNLDAGVELESVVERGRQAYIVWIDGGLKVDGSELGEAELGMREAVEVVGGNEGHVELRIKALSSEGAQFMMIEMTQ